MIIGKNKTQNKNKDDDMRRKAAEWSLEMLKHPKRLLGGLCDLEIVVTIIVVHSKSY